MRGFDLKAYLLLKQLIEEGSGNININQIQSDWNQEDETQADFIKNKPDIATNDDAIDCLIEQKYITPIYSIDGLMYTNKNGEIYTI